MPRPKDRLGTLALLILVAALACALVVQRRREAALRAELQRSRAEARRERADLRLREVLQDRLLGWLLETPQRRPDVLQRLEAIEAAEAAATPGPR